MKFLVTGGAGFIGSNLVEALLIGGHRVKVIDNFSTGKKENLQKVINKIELIEGDIRDFELVKKSAKGVDFILHQAAVASVPWSIIDPLLVNEVNITGTLNILVAAKEEGVKRVVCADSSSVYGDVRILPTDETVKCLPLSPYAVTKYAGELYGNVFYKLYGLETVFLRYFNVFGPKQDPKNEYAAVIPKFILAMLKGKPPIIYGDGEQSRDFIYVDDIIQANLKACEEIGIGGEVFNIASQSEITLNRLVEIINTYLGTEIKPIYAESRKGDIKHSIADISKARRMLKFNPTFTFEEGIAKTIEWFKKESTS